MARQMLQLVNAAIIEEEMELQEMLLAIGNLAAAVIMNMEEGFDFEEIRGVVWEKVTVNVDDYRRMQDPCFKLHFRMTKVVFEALVVEVGNHLRANNRLQRERTPLDHILMMVVWVMATPDSFRSVALKFGVTPGVLHYHYSYIIEALREMAPNYIRWPTEEERDEIKAAFQRVTGFPGAVGCIDGTHVYITAPLEEPARYTNRHHSYSINTQAVVDHHLVVRDLHVGEAGSLHDNRVFRRSPLYHSLLEDADNRMLRPDEHLLGDSAYTLTDFMQVPFDNNGHLTEQQLNYNRRLSQGRVRVENAFCRGKTKWRRLKMLHAMNAQYVVDHITSSFVLHNFVILNGDQLNVDALDEELINYNEIGPNDREHDGNDGDEEDDADDHPMLAAAKARGTEKRLFIMNHVLPMEMEAE